MKRLTQAVMLLLCSLSAAQAVAPGSSGISFYVLRVIYPESAKNGATLNVNNKSAAPYLMQSWIRPVDPNSGEVDLNYGGQPKMPFIVTPPLARLEANSELTLRIRRNGEPLPTDRESVFFISMKAIPAKKALSEPAASGQMALTVVSNMKLFYRPAGLATRAVADVASQLRFQREGDVLIAENPTPYWLTFSQLQVGDVALGKPALRLMVPPKGQQRYALPTGTNGKVVWKLIDEDGWDTPGQQQDW
ncbi:MULTISPECIES: molecular chaperone [unclassified Serratia (in: enterobacteria)]|uniref:fimbrial biogenesis chaperone n=1 Tax=unclassified Serratia (in: enterobacteria) TaxID=2647522 RepID=UPI000500B3E1|nr:MULTISPECIES: molecular chaperone [unclassified Serratia (in: enterobacteria)]KFK96377.1 fimbrial chaperone protein [Serratia sp. Ag2]KFK99852.1 fimbrial chaperone protein [Serratia sp. Ag1]